MLEEAKIKQELLDRIADNPDQATYVLDYRFRDFDFEWFINHFKDKNLMAIWTIFRVS